LPQQEKRKPVQGRGERSSEAHQRAEEQSEEYVSAVIANDAIFSADDKPSRHDVGSFMIDSGASQHITLFATHSATLDRFRNQCVSTSPSLTLSSKLELKVI